MHAQRFILIVMAWAVLGSYYYAKGQVNEGTVFIGEPLKVRVGDHIYRVGIGYWIDPSNGKKETYKRLENGEHPIFVIDEEGKQIDDESIIRKSLFVRMTANTIRPSRDQGSQCINIANELRTFLMTSDLSAAVLAIRDFASRGIVHAGAAALTGGTSTSASIKSLAVSITKEAAKGMVLNAMTDPQTYAELTARSIVIEAIERLEKTETLIIHAHLDGIWDFENASQIFQDYSFGKSCGIPAKVLLGRLLQKRGGQVDLLSQLGKITESMVDEALRLVTETESTVKPLYTEYVAGRAIVTILQDIPEFMEFFRTRDHLQKYLIADSQLKKYYVNENKFVDAFSEEISYMMKLGGKQIDQAYTFLWGGKKRTVPFEIEKIVPNIQGASLDFYAEAPSQWDTISFSISIDEQIVVRENLTGDSNYIKRMGVNPGSKIKVMFFNGSDQENKNVLQNYARTRCEVLGGKVEQTLVAKTTSDSDEIFEEIEEALTKIEVDKERKEQAAYELRTEEEHVAQDRDRALSRRQLELNQWWLDFDQKRRMRLARLRQDESVIMEEQQRQLSAFVDEQARDSDEHIQRMKALVEQFMETQLPSDLQTSWEYDVPEPQHPAGEIGISIWTNISQISALNQNNQGVENPIISYQTNRNCNVELFLQISNFEELQENMLPDAGVLFKRHSILRQEISAGNVYETRCNPDSAPIIEQLRKTIAEQLEYFLETREKIPNQVESLRRTRKKMVGNGYSQKDIDWSIEHEKKLLLLKEQAEEHLIALRSMRVPVVFSIEGRDKNGTTGYAQTVVYIGL